jgi:serine phosphatase RsbU (regulator of sigma subunit)
LSGLKQQAYRSASCPRAATSTIKSFLGSGDLLIVFTDGVVEAENEAQTEFGETRLVEYVTTMHPASAADALRSLMSFQAGEKP